MGAPIDADPTSPHAQTCGGGNGNSNSNGGGGGNPIPISSSMGSLNGGDYRDDHQAPFVINKWCPQCWPKLRSNVNEPEAECLKTCDEEQRNTEPIVTILWPPVAVEGQPQTNVVVRPPPANFDFSHMQYLPCGYGRQCKHGITCTRAHSSPPQAEIAYWNFVQPLGAPSRRRRAASQKTTGKDWSLTTLFECKICQVRMNSAAQLVQHQSGSKHRAQMVASNLKTASVPTMVLSSGGGGSPGVLPHGTGPYYNTMTSSSDWSPARAGPEDTMEVPPGPEIKLMGKDDPVAMAQWTGMQAYITAVKAGDNDEVKRLLSEGIDVDTRDSGCPALHWAIFMGRVDTVALLVQAGARKDLQDRDRQTAVHICVHPRHGMMNQMRRESKSTKAPNNYEQDAVMVLTTLMKAGWSPDMRDALGRTGLHHVAEQGNCTLAYILLQFKANPALHNKDGYSPTDVATLKAKSEGLTKYVQLRDLLRTALFDARTSGSDTNPMAIPSGADMPLQAAGGPGGSNLKLGVSVSSSMVGATAGPGMSASGHHGDSVDANPMAPATLPPLGGGSSVATFDTGGSDDVDSAFRPLLAALASLSSTSTAFAERGVDINQLEVRMQEVLSFTGVNFKSYIQHAQKAGIIDIRDAKNGHQRFVSIARRFASLVVQPPPPSISESSSQLFGSASMGSMIPASQSLQWHRGSHAHARATAAAMAARSQPTIGHPSNRMQDVIQQETKKTGAASPLDYEALVSDVISSPEVGDSSELNRISHSFMFDPFASANHLGPEPLFGHNDARPTRTLSNKAPGTPTSTMTSKAPGTPTSSAGGSALWQASHGPGALGGDAWSTGIRPNPMGGIPSSVSFADMSMLRTSTLNSNSGSAGGGASANGSSAGGLPWPSSRVGNCPRSDSLPSFGSFGSRPGPPGLGRSGQVPSDPWLSKPVPQWATSPGPDGSGGLSSSIDWLNIAGSPK
eukprot:m.174366 g.174366  ORF g.174366 m.174366 type:complete len:962 (-) comp13823_c0_seq1:300-3185(-)